MTFSTTNPSTGEIISQYRYFSDEELDYVLDKSFHEFSQWKKTGFAERSKLFEKAALVLEEKSEDFARIMAHEMGKPVREGMAEVKKCALACRFYAENGKKFLETETHDSDGSESYVTYEPLGIVLAIMPWNYPFWQVFRAAAPIIMSGNVMLLKHASNVPECALAIESVFTDAGFPEYVFRSVFLPGKKAEEVISDRRIAAVTITGSTNAGRKVGAAAGTALKPSVLELGGSDPFIVLEDADINLAAQVGVMARCLNSGQSCIAAKRFIIHKMVYNSFIEEFVAGVQSRVMGDPLSKDTDIGPQAREDLRDELAVQVKESVKKGAKILCGGKIPDKKGAWYPPTVLVNVKPGMPAFDEELFGPVAAFIKAENEEDAIKLANMSEFGLGASLWSKDIEKGKTLASKIEAGAVFINGLTKSDPRLPFGGIKNSGYGRELSREGMLEFVNIKTVWIK